MTVKEDPAIFVLLVVPGSKVRSLLMSTIANLPTGLGFPSQETAAWNGEGVTSRFTVDLLSSETLATMLKLAGQSAPVLVLQQGEAGDNGGGSREPGEEEHPEGQANGQDLLASVLAAATEKAALDHPDSQDQEPLSPREVEILALLAEGASNQLLSQSLCISLNTVKTHVKNVMRKLNTTNREQTALVGKLIIQSNYERPSDKRKRNGEFHPKRGDSRATLGPLAGLLGVIERMA